MKKKLIYVFLIILFVPGIVHAETQYPSSTGFVNDFANVINQQDHNNLESLIRRLKDKTTAEIAVVTMETIGDEPIDSYAAKLFEKWKIGEKNKDNGVLILAAIKDKKIKIEVGYGLEGAITDGRAGEILDRLVVPNFKQGNYSKGLSECTLEIVRIIAKEYNVDLGVGKPTEEKSLDNFVDPDIVLLIIIIIIILLSSRRGKRGGFFIFPGPFMGGGGGYGNHSGNFGGSGFGGFGGFGGGMSGGGGAGRGW
ncbi:TPM domain-containing protein [Candidatus Poribacteria bacterium]|nr:TPM domain-containing protein [Candidatus Poribacteria bacterium]